MLNAGADMVFVSHANPENNDFSLWLSLQLAKLGYPVWCDLTRLLGGEDFWSDIEVAIRERTAKFLFVLSRDSNHKDGPLRELSVARSVARGGELKDFVIPLRIDDLPFQDINIELFRLNAIDFSASWAVGLRQLVAKLELDGVSKDPRFNPGSVAAWWTGDGPGQDVLRSPEEYVSNWFAIESLPDDLYLHALPPNMTLEQLLNKLPFPFRKVGNLLVCFGSQNDVNEYLSNGVRVSNTLVVKPLDFLHGVDGDVRVSAGEAHRVLVNLLRRGWWQFVRSVGMLERRRERSSDYYLQLGHILNDRVDVPSEAGGSSWRSLVGYRTLGMDDEGDPRRRYWHFAVSVWVAFDPFPMYQLVPHIVFSSDGKRPIDDSVRVHGFRRSQAKDWWNPQWRDRTLGLMWWLAGRSSSLLVPLGPGVSAQVNSLPVSFESPVSYLDP